MYFPEEEEMEKKKVIEGIVEYDNIANDYFIEFIYINGKDIVKYLKPYIGKKVRITIELIEETEHG